MIRAPEAGSAGAPYAVVIAVAPRGDDRALKDEHGAVLLSGFSGARVGDPFNPAFLAELDARFELEVAPRRDDPRLQMWFAGNESGLFDVAGHGGGGVRDLRRWLWSDVPEGSSIDRVLCARHALAAFLREHYADSIAELNLAWDADYPDFAAIVDTGPRPVPYVHDANARCRQDLQHFVHDRLLREWVRAVTLRMRAADPNHLIASPRLAIARPRSYRFWTGRQQSNPDHWAESPAAPVGTGTTTAHYSPFDLLGRDGLAGFDLVAINVYTGAPRFPDPWFSDGLNKGSRGVGPATDHQRVRHPRAHRRLVQPRRRRRVRAALSSHRRSTPTGPAPSIPDRPVRRLPVSRRRGVARLERPLHADRPPACRSTSDSSSAPTRDAACAPAGAGSRPTT